MQDSIAYPPLPLYFIARHADVDDRGQLIISPNMPFVQAIIGDTAVMPFFFTEGRAARFMEQGNVRGEILCLGAKKLLELLETVRPEAVTFDADTTLEKTNNYATDSVIDWLKTELDK